MFRFSREAFAVNLCLCSQITKFPCILITYRAISAQSINSSELPFARRSCPAFGVGHSATPGDYPLNLEARLSHTPSSLIPRSRVSASGSARTVLCLARYPWVAAERTPPPATPAGDRFGGTPRASVRIADLSPRPSLEIPPRLATIRYSPSHGRLTLYPMFYPVCACYAFGRACTSPVLRTMPLG